MPVRKIPTPSLTEAIPSERYSLTRQQIFDAVASALLPNANKYPRPSARKHHYLPNSDLRSPFGAVLPPECFVPSMNILTPKQIYEHRAQFGNRDLNEWLDANYRGNENLFYKFTMMYRRKPYEAWLAELRLMAKGYGLSPAVALSYADAINAMPKRTNIQSRVKLKKPVRKPKD